MVEATGVSGRTDIIGPAVIVSTTEGEYEGEVGRLKLLKTREGRVIIHQYIHKETNA